MSRGIQSLNWKDKMLNHIVIFKLKEEFQGKKKDKIAKEIKEKLEELPRLVREIVYYEVGINSLNDPRAYDLVLISKFESLQSLENYKNNEHHKRTLAFILERALDAKVVDFYS